MTDAIKPLRLATIYLKDFRCFDEFTINLDSSIVLVCGSNGVGKTSLLEALSYACYLRSFRKQLPRDLVSFGKESFFIKLNVHDSAWDGFLEHNIHIGFVNGKRLIKVNNKAISSYKELLQHYRIVSLTEDDLTLIKGAPLERRAFLDQTILLGNPSFACHIREFRSVLENRNALLQKERVDKEAYMIWTQLLWEKTRIIQQARRQILDKYMSEINSMLSTYFDNAMSITLSYRARKQNETDSFDTFLQKKDALMVDELRYRRSLFGAHLDDFEINFREKRSKSYASRGQQKLIVLLLKSAVVKQLAAHNESAIFLLDDFMTDFDHKHAQTLLSVLLHLNCQLIFTSPHQDSALSELLKKNHIDFKMITI